MRNDLWQARVDFAAVFRWSARLGYQTGTCNHYSLMVPGSDDRFLVNPEGLFWSEITASSLLLCDLDGKVIEGEGKLERTAYCLHAPIHRMNPKARALLHTHMPYATALCLLDGGRLEPTNQTAVVFWDRIAYDENYLGLAMEPEEGVRVGNILGDKDIVMMRNHGPMVSGPSIAQAFGNLYFLEEACKVQLIAMSANRPMKPIQPKIAESVVKEVQTWPEYADTYLVAIKRTLDREEPDYAS
ncbi:MAG: aldolase [Proteobacteria bacterium]|nr:aldolase [Pseudomonadota bacterium]MBI3497861.1 aldolase [Pseudomonadota bacterium]